MKIALIELSESHEECLYSQVKFIGVDNQNLKLFLNPNVASRIDDYGLSPSHIYQINLVKNSFERWIYAFELAKTLGSFDRLIFNTSSSNKLLRNLLLILNLYPCECIGILHNTKKLGSSFTQSLISIKMKKYFVLGDHLIKQPIKGKIKLKSFYPIFFPEYSVPLKKPKDEIWVVIPGSIDFNRRDYFRLLTCLSNNPNIDNLKIILLGKLNDSFQQGFKLKKEITSRNLGHYFQLFHDFIPNDTFHSYLAKADFVMPLLTLNEDYLNHKISGSFNLAFSYKKPLLAHRFFRAIPDIRNNSYLYDEDNLYGLLGRLKTLEGNKEFYSSDKWNYEHQQKRYLEFLNS